MLKSKHCITEQLLIKGIVESNGREAWEYYNTLANDNTEKISQLAVQGSNIEVLLTDIIKIFRDTEKSVHSTQEKIFEFEQNADLHKREVSEMLEDLENRYSYFQESLQSEVSSIMKTQRESNSNLENFVQIVEERTSSFERAINKKISTHTETLDHKLSAFGSGSGGSRDAEVYSKNMQEFERLSKANLEKISDFEKRFDNFRNEINRLILELEGECDERNKRSVRAFGIIAKKLDISNPVG